MDGMDMSGMSGMGGMDMSSAGMFTSDNKAIAHIYWYLIAVCVGLLAAKKHISSWQSRRWQKAHSQGRRNVPSRPEGALTQAYATATATVRELSYPQPVWFSGRISKFFSPLPLGRWLILAVYWVVLLTMLWSNVILSKGSSEYAYKWEKVGFRAAWVSVTQIPFVVLLSCKFNPISILTGISYERFNWLHRWAARTVFLTIIVHWSYFFREWVLADFVKYQFEMMPMVKYGFGAWAVIGWMILSGFGYFRALNYEFFVAQHICAAATLLWLVYVHVPSYARYNVWMSVAFITFDWGARVVWGVLRNTHILGKLSSKTPGYSATTEVLPGDMVRVTLESIDFQWKAGQHVHISMPTLRPFEIHPFTVANASESPQPDTRRELVLMIKAHSGFSKSLHQAAQKDGVTGRKRRVFLNGPWGAPPDLRHYETVVLIACSSGASFIVPILQSLVAKRGCVQKLEVHWIVRSRLHITWFEKELLAAVEIAQEAHVHLRINVHVTQPYNSEAEPTETQNPDIEDNKTKDQFLISTHSASGSSSDSLSSSDNEKLARFATEQKALNDRHARLRVTPASRPTVESMIRPAVEAAVGETAVVTCGGLSITAQARTFVAALSDERAVHKGTGAQGIYLFTETYGW